MIVTILCYLATLTTARPSDVSMTKFRGPPGARFNKIRRPNRVAADIEGNGGGGLIPGPPSNVELSDDSWWEFVAEEKADLRGASSQQEGGNSRSFFGPYFFSNIGQSPLH